MIFGGPTQGRRQSPWADFSEVFFGTTSGNDQDRIPDTGIGL